MEKQHEIDRIALQIDSILLIRYAHLFSPEENYEGRRRLSYILATELVTNQECPIRSKDGFEIEQTGVGTQSRMSRDIAFNLGLAIKPIDYKDK